MFDTRQCLLRFTSTTFMADNFNVVLEDDETKVLDVGVIQVDPMLKKDVWLLGKLLNRARVTTWPMEIM